MEQKIYLDASDKNVAAVVMDFVGGTLLCDPMDPKSSPTPERVKHLYAVGKLMINDYLEGRQYTTRPDYIDILETLSDDPNVPSIIDVAIGFRSASGADSVAFIYNDPEKNFELIKNSLTPGPAQPVYN